MAYEVDNTLISNREMLGILAAKIGATLAAPFVAIAKNGTYYTALAKLNATSDEELAAKGLTRAQAIQRIFPHDG